MLMNLNERSLYIKQLYNTYIIHICCTDNGNTHTDISWHEGYIVLSAYHVICSIYLTYIN